MKILSFWKDPEFYFSVVLLIFITLVLVSCAELSARGRMIPLIVAIVSLPLAILNVLACIFPPLKTMVHGLKAAELVIKEDKFEKEGKKALPPFSEAVKVILWFFGAYVVFLIGGYLPMVLSFSLLFLRFRIHFTWTRAFLMTAIFGFSTWAVFTLLLGLEPFGVRYYY